MLIRPNAMKHYWEFRTYLHKVFHLSSLDDILELTLFGGREAMVAGLVRKNAFGGVEEPKVTTT
jgi:hypothetical protein